MGKDKVEEKSSQELDKFLDEVGKTFGKELVFKLGSNKSIDIDRFSTGSLGLNNAVGGGFPYGRIVEIYGGESSGKTTLTLHAAAECQKDGRRVAFIDMEHAFDKVYAENLGVNVDELVFTQPNNGEEALSLAEKFISSGLFGLVVVDSVAALVPKKELEGEMGDSVMGLHARLMSQAMRKLTPITLANKCTVIFINQIRHKIGVMFGSPETTTGGNALKFYASIRLKTTRIGSNKDNDGNLVSNRTKVRVEKNKTAPPFRIAEFDIKYGEGVDKVSELIDIASELKIIDKAGSWFSYSGEKLGQGKEKVSNLLSDNPELFDEIYEKILNYVEV